jgi:periplasmic protein CpxP/Spy
MKTNIKMIFLMAALCLSGQILAQDERPAGNETHENLTAEERATKRTERMKTELSLTTDQEKEIYTINLEHILQMDQLRAEQKALREKMHAEKEANRTKIKAVLTPEQNVIFDQKAEEHKQKQQERHKNRHD